MPLTLEDILAADDLQIETVPTPEWGGDVCIRPLDGNARDRYDQIRSEKMFPEDGGQADWSGLRAALVGLALCDERGTLANPTELQLMQLGQKSGAALDRVHTRVRDISGLGVDAVEHAEKNSPTGQNESSG
jgi:hypothetical protein